MRRGAATLIGSTSSGVTAIAITAMVVVLGHGDFGVARAADSLQGTATDALRPSQSALWVRELS